MQYEEILTDLERAMKDGNREVVAELVPELKEMSERLQHQPGLSAHLEKGRFNGAARERLRKDYISQYVLLRGGGPFDTNPQGETIKPSPFITNADAGEDPEGVRVPGLGMFQVGNYLPCRVMAPISIPLLENNRNRTLYAAHLLCALCIWLSILAFVGGYARGETLNNLAWVTIETDKGIGNAGVKWVCWDLPNPDGKPGSYWECQTWYDFDCKAGVTDAAACDACKHQSTKMAMSVFLGIFSYISYLHMTDRRLRGTDSNYLKFHACLAALVGGTNSLYAVVSYWTSCILSVRSDPSMTVSPGPGLICLSIAVCLKVFMGGVQLGLPVLKPLRNKTSVEDPMRTHSLRVYGDDPELNPDKSAPQQGFKWCC